MDHVEFRGNGEDICERIAQAGKHGVIASDFDGTDAKSPLLEGAAGYVMKNFLRNPSLALWAVSAAVRRYLLEGKDAESSLWNEFAGLAGDDMPAIVENIRERVSRERYGDHSAAESYFLPGVKDFYELFPEAETFYVSRNFDDIIGIFSDELGMPRKNAICVGGDKLMKTKGQALEQIIKANEGKAFILRGDSHSDDEVVDVADFYKNKKGLIPDYVAIAVGKSSHDEHRNVEVITPADQRELLRYISRYAV